MKTIAAFLIFALAATSCATQKRCLEKWPPQIDPIDTVVVTHVKDTTIYRDTTITIRIPADTVRDTVKIEAKPKSEYSADTARSETEYAKATAWIQPGPGGSADLHLQLE